MAPMKTMGKQGQKAASAVEKAVTKPAAAAVTAPAANAPTFAVPTVPARGKKNESKTTTAPAAAAAPSKKRKADVALAPATNTTTTAATTKATTGKRNTAKTPSSTAEDKIALPAASSSSSSSSSANKAAWEMALASEELTDDDATSESDFSELSELDDMSSDGESTTPLSSSSLTAAQLKGLDTLVQETSKKLAERGIVTKPGVKQAKAVAAAAKSKSKAAPASTATTDDEEMKDDGDDDDDDDEEEEDDDSAEPESASAPSAKRAKTTKAGQKNTNKKKKAVEEDTTGRGVIYLGHIPYGFFEREMRAFFSQFGTVTRLRLARNRKTGKSRHYAFIEFEHDTVAEVVASSMNRYMMFGRSLVCELVPRGRVHPKMFANCDERLRITPWRRINRERHNRVRTPEDAQRRAARLASRERRKLAQLAAMGIKYDFAGYTHAKTSAAAATEKPE